MRTLTTIRRAKKTMALVTMIMGESGAGKSASLRNFKKNEVNLS